MILVVTVSGVASQYIPIFYYSSPRQHYEESKEAPKRCSIRVRSPPLSQDCWPSPWWYDAYFSCFLYQTRWILHKRLKGHHIQVSICMHLPSFEECNITYKFFHMQLFARVRSLLYMDRYRQQFEFAKPFSFLCHDYPFKAYSMYICKYIYIYTVFCCAWDWAQYAYKSGS